MNLGDIPRRNARRHPHRVGVVDGAERWSWPAVDERVNQLANALAARRVERGERVAILAHNSHRFLELYWALAKLGAIAVPLNYRLTEGELARLLDHAGATTMFAGAEYVDTARALAAELPDLRWVVALDGAADGLDDHEGLLAGGSPEEPEVRATDDDPFAIMYTSGTTGLPKGAVVTHGNLASNTRNQAIADKADPADVNLVATPMYHMGALFMGTTYAALGCTTVILERFEAGEVVRAIDRERVTVCLLVPTMVNMVLADPQLDEHDLGSLRLIFYGGSPMPLAVLRRAIARFGCSFTQGYGLTETIEATFLTAADHVLDGSPETERRLASAGREALDAEVRVVDDADRDLDAGEIGEVLVRGPSVIREYWRSPEETRAAIRDGWFHTGDLGYRDDDGYLFVVDRKKDLIISGGENVYPAEVEQVVYLHPAVHEAAVIGVPDETWGEAVVAVVVPKADAECPSEQDLVDHCRDRLASFQRPRTVRFVDALPRNPSGKVLKRELRAAMAPTSGSNA